MSHFLALQSTYTHVACALFNGQSFVDHIQINKIHASKKLLLEIESLLAKHAISFDTLSFCAVNHGPGPYTTLRTVIATMNGLAFATQKPLVPVDGITTFLNEHHQKNTATIALLNAFGGDVYFGIKTDKTIEIGCDNATSFLKQCAQRLDTQVIRFIGNGTEKYKENISESFPKAEIINVAMPSIESIGLAGFDLWEQKKTVDEIMPRYIKRPV